MIQFHMLVLFKNTIIMIVEAKQVWKKDILNLQSLSLN